MKTKIYPVLLLCQNIFLTTEAAENSGKKLDSIIDLAFKVNDGFGVLGTAMRGSSQAKAKLSSNRKAGLGLIANKSVAQTTHPPEAGSDYINEDSVEVDNDEAQPLIDLAGHNGTNTTNPADIGEAAALDLVGNSSDNTVGRLGSETDKAQDSNGTIKLSGKQGPINWNIDVDTKVDPDSNNGTIAVGGDASNDTDKEGRFKIKSVISLGFSGEMLNQSKDATNGVEEGEEPPSDGDQPLSDSGLGGEDYIDDDDDYDGAEVDNPVASGVGVGKKPVGGGGVGARPLKTVVTNATQTAKKVAKKSKQLKHVTAKSAK